MPGELILFTVTFRANPANNLTCSPSYIMLFMSPDLDAARQFRDASVAPPFPFYTAPSHACAIVADDSRSPTQIYVSNRGDDSVASFVVHSAAGSAPGASRIALRAHAPCTPGRLPWDLALSSCGDFAVVSTQFGAALDVAGGGIALFARSDEGGGDERGGALSALGGAAACRQVVPNVLLTRFVRP